jgi:hypothetical protein
MLPSLAVISSFVVTYGWADFGELSRAGASPSRFTRHLRIVAIEHVIHITAHRGSMWPTSGGGGANCKKNGS